MNIKLVLLIATIAITSISYSQKEKESLLNIWNNNTLADSMRANAYNTYIKGYDITKYPDSAYTAVKELYDFTVTKKLKKEQADVLLTEGDIYFVLGALKKSLNLYNRALDIYEELNNKKGIATTLTSIGSIYGNEFKFSESLKYYEKSLALFESLKDTANISKVLIFIGNHYNSIFKLDEASRYFNKSLDYVKLTNNLEIKALIYSRLADNFERRKEYTEALKLYSESLEISRKINDLDGERNTLFALSSCFLNQKNYDKCITYGKESLAIGKDLVDNMYSVATYYNLADSYKAKKNIELAFKYLESATSLESQIKQFSANRALQKLEIEKIKLKDSLLKVEENTRIKLAHEIEINKKNKENKDLTLAWGGSLSALSIFAFIVFKKTKRKQRKAEQERQKQIEEKEKILKDLELSTIDAMIEGQEKERERLAYDLHDSVGATLATAKLQFDYFIKNQNEGKYSEELIKKTSTLLEDAYVEIRSMAHLKNAGVMAKNGLLPAVEKLSANASGINGLTIEVQSFGLESRLENALEISIFRIIQELVTNIIKHANATKGAVHLTNHEHVLNIMVEDNGKGFNPNQITKTNAGMGISSIDKRVDHLDGKLTIESEINKGTTVIIDIPL